MLPSLIKLNSLRPKQSGMEPPITWLKRGRGSLSHWKPTAKASRHKEKEPEARTIGRDFQPVSVQLKLKAASLADPSPR